MPFPLSPWHMWGTSQRVQVTQIGASLTSFAQTVQLAKIDYRRPDTWSFLFGAEVVEAPDADGVNPIDLFVDFEVIAGVGRSNLDMRSEQITTGPAASVTGKGFCRFAWRWLGALAKPTVKWTSRVVAPTLDETLATPDRVFLDHFPAETIQCRGRIGAETIGTPTPNETITCVLHSYFAPRSHVRPEWYDLDGGPKKQYRGLEQKGS